MESGIRPIRFQDLLICTIIIKRHLSETGEEDANWWLINKLWTNLQGWSLLKLSILSRGGGNLYEN